MCVYIKKMKMMPAFFCFFSSFTSSVLCWTPSSSRLSLFKHFKWGWERNNCAWAGHKNLPNECQTSPYTPGEKKGRASIGVNLSQLGRWQHDRVLWMLSGHLCIFPLSSPIRASLAWDGVWEKQRCHFWPGVLFCQWRRWSAVFKHTLNAHFLTL